MIWVFSFIIILWCFLEASFWWVAPDISIILAYIYFPKYWKRFVLLGLLGAALGSVVTYSWAYYDPDSWIQYVTQMPFHSRKNIHLIDKAMEVSNWSIIQGGWSGLPYKLYIGVGAMSEIGIFPLLIIGLIARLLRFLFSLLVTTLIKKATKPWSERHTHQFAMLITLIFIGCVALFDIVFNKLLA